MYALAQPRAGFSAAALAVKITASGSGQQNRTTHSVPRSWFFYLFSNKRQQGLMEKWLTLGLGLEIYKMISMESYVKGHRSPAESVPDGQSWGHLSNKINNAVMD